MKSTVMGNPGGRRLVLALFFIALFAVLLSALTGMFACRALEIRTLRHESAVAGRLLREHPGLDAFSVAAAFSGGENGKDREIGGSAFEKAGFNRDTAGIVLPFYKESGFFYALEGAVPVLLFLSIALFLIYRCLRRLYGGVDLAARAAGSVTGGNFVRLAEYEEGAFSRLARAFNDMSASMRAAMEKSEENRRFLKSLISDISHQLKTPLSALRLYNEITLREDCAGAVRPFLEKSAEQLDRMEWLVQSLLKSARLEANAVELDRKPVDAAALARGCAEDLEPLADKKGVAVKIEDEGAPAVVLGDAAWLTQAVENVVKNCIEHTPRGGTVKVRSEQSPITVKITISDTGAGIAPDDLPHIFKRFYTGSTGGAGLGLSLARDIAEKTGGMLTAESGYGKGAAFTFTFIKTII